MRYNPFGYRFFSGASNQDGDVFLYSSQGQLVAKYKISGNTLKLNYLPIYEGSKRIGIVEPEDVSWLDCPELMLCGLVAIDPCMIMVEGQPKPPCRKDSSLKADRKYELTDHLGNVRVVIANQRIPVDTNNDSLVDYYKPLVKEISDYYPYGWVKFYGDYEFGANAGSLFEDWDSTRGTYYTLYRLLDARIARWYQVEPKIETYGTWSGYSYVFNNPVISVDVLGLDTFIYERDKNGKWILKKIISSDDPIEHEGYFALPSGEKQEYARFIVRDDSGRIVSDEVIALKRVVNRGGRGWLVRLHLWNRLVKGTYYELVGFSIDSISLISTGKIEPSDIDLIGFSILGSILRWVGARAALYGSMRIAEGLLKMGRLFEFLSNVPLVAQDVANGNLLIIPMEVASEKTLHFMSNTVFQSISNKMIKSALDESTKLKLEILKITGGVIIDSILNKQRGPIQQIQQKLGR